jgi:hypothetical protein
MHQGMRMGWTWIVGLSAVKFVESALVDGRKHSEKMNKQGLPNSKFDFMQQVYQKHQK